MNSTDFAYAAGYIDGDGCFQIGNQKWGSHLVIVSVRKDSIIWFMEHFDGTCRVIKPKTSNRSNSYHFRFSEKGLEQLPNIYKYLVEKKEECSLFQEFRNVIGNAAKKLFVEKMKLLKNKDGLIPSSIKEELMNIRNSITPNLEDFAYLAGYIDAECSLDINRTKQGTSDLFTYRPQLQCNNSKSPFFYWASERFGGQFHFLDKSHIPNCRNQMLWRISNLQLDPILNGILPFLKIKKNICEKMIELRKINKREKGRISPNDPQFYEKFAPIYQAKKLIYEQVLHLNNFI